MQRIISLISAFLITNGTVSRAQVEFDVLNTPTENTFVASSFINDEEGWLADNHSILWHTQDAGVSMDTIFTGKQFTNMDFIDSENGFATGDAAVYRTIDGGHTWDSLPLENAAGAVYFINKNLGFVSGVKTIYKTTDNGQTWSTISIEPRAFVDYHFVDESTGIAAAQDFSENKPLWKTTDGGLSWTNLFDDYHYYLNSVWFSNEDTGFSAGYFDQGGATHEPVILKITDGGETWETAYHNLDVMGVGETFTDIRFKNSSEGFAISNLNVNVFTIDGGITWLRADETDSFDLPEFDGYYKTIGGTNSLYFTGTDGYVVKWK